MIQSPNGIKATMQNKDQKSKQKNFRLVRGINIRAIK
jgi:hypothetical protein